uniref:Uncharacterized protein n=1 Tax=Nanning Tombu tick virus 1 TaxID=2972341 RepID=A0A9E7V1Z4_9TOMB|nr:MAG: hypothetical protein [Nanning Tombu tick virus 1]
MTNVSPVPLYVVISISIPQVYKSGIGRPDIQVTSHGVTQYDGKKSTSATVKTGEPKKGLTYDAELVLASGGFLDLELLNVNYDNVMLPNFVSLTATDDFGTSVDVVPPPTTRDTFDGGDNQVDDHISTGGITAFWVNYTGFFPTTDPNGFSTQAATDQLPPGVSVVPITSGQATVLALRNDSGRRYLITDTSAYINADPNRIQRMGNIDGGVYADGTGSRNSIIETFNPGAVYYVGFFFSGQYNSYQTYVNLVFLETQKQQYS